MGIGRPTGCCHQCYELLPSQAVKQQGGAGQSGRREVRLQIFRSAGVGLVLLALSSCREATQTSAGEPMTADDFYRELVDLPLCGTPTTGEVAGKTICTIHFIDGAMTLAGAGIVARGLWEVVGDTICRRDIGAPADQRHCVSYGRLPKGHYRNSDGVEFCIGPCP
jgi:hypothetical protein